MSADLNSIKKDILEYIDVRLDLIKLNAAEALSRVISNAINIAAITCLLCLILFFLSFAAGYYFSSLLGSDMLGFLVVAGFYSLLLIIILVFRKQIIDRPVIKAMIKLFYPKSPDNEK